MSAHDREDTTRGRKGSATAGQGTPAPVPVSTSARARWTIALFLAGPVIWSLHFLLVYLVVDAGCTGSGPGLEVFAPPVPTVVTILATLVAAVACLGAAALSYRRWRSDRHGPDARTDLAPAEGVGTLAFMGLLLALLGFVTVLFVGVPALFLPACLP